MRKLGLSIYPEKSDVIEIKKYLLTASKIGFTRIFSCLLSVNKPKEAIIQEFKEINIYAHELGYEIIMDVSPRVFNRLDINYHDLSFFKKIHADGIRLDQGFTGNEESIMTFNKEDLKIEINMSNDTHTVDTIMDYQPNHYNLIGCHNFYPHNYSGLSLEHFNKCTDNFKKYGLRTAAFISSQNQETFGPWPVTDGLVTLEMHRNMPIDVQAKHFVALGNIDDIIISNCYPNKDELLKMAKVRLDMLSLNVHLVDKIPNVEKSIVLDELHFNRGDVSNNFIRSTQSRVKYKGHDFVKFNVPKIIKRGDVIIESSDYGHYAGELQIAKNDMKNNGKSNVVGRIVDEEIFLIDYIKPWQKFRFSEV